MLKCIRTQGSDGYERGVLGSTLTDWLTNCKERRRCNVFTHERCRIGLKVGLRVAFNYDKYVVGVAQHRIGVDFGLFYGVF